MTKVEKVHQKKTPVRRHYLREWMEYRSFSVRDLVDAGIADRSTVYRWLDGQLPQPSQQEKLAGFFDQYDEPTFFFRHPDADWLSRFFEGRAKEERDRIKKAMEFAWPRPTGTED